MGWIVGELFLGMVALAALLGARGGVFVIPGRTDDGRMVREARDLNSQVRISAIAGFAVLSLVVTWVNAYHQVETGHVGVVSSFGEIVDLTPDGGQFIAPWKTLEEVNIQLQKAEFRQPRTSDDTSALGNISADSRTTQNVFLDVTVNWRIDPGGVQELLSTVGDDHFAILVPSRVREFFKQEIVKFDAVDVTAQQEPIRQAVIEKLRTDLAPFHIILQSIQIDDVSYEAGFEQQIELKVLEDEKAKTAEQAVATKSAEADQLRVETEGLAAARIVAAQAEADEIRLLGDAKAVANTSIAASLTETLIQFEALQLLEGVSVAIVPAGQGLFLDPTTFLTDSGSVPAPLVTEPANNQTEPDG